MSVALLFPGRVADYAMPPPEYLSGNLLQLLARGGGKREQRVANPDAFEKQRQDLQPEKRQHGRANAYPVHTPAYGQPDAGRSPKAGRRRQSPDDLLLENDGSRPQKAYAADDLSCYAARIELHVGSRKHAGESVLRNDHKQRAAQRDQKMRAETGLFGPVLAVESDDGAQNAGQQQPPCEIPKHASDHMISAYRANVKNRAGISNRSTL